MVRRSFWRLLVALAAVLALATPAFAGGWAVVTLDALPSEIQAGQTTSLGFMVRQHGVTPIDENPWENKPLVPFLSARNISTGQTIQAEARKEGPLGHFVVDATFPSAGSWDIEITPPPFAGTKLGVFTVAAMAQSSVQQEGQLKAASNPFFTRSPRIWWLTGLVLVTAVMLTAWVQRESLARLLPVRSQRPARATDEA